MNHHHHHPGMTLGPLPIGMLANGSGTPVGIGIRLPIMTASLPPLVHQPPPASSANASHMIVSVSPDSSEDIDKCLRMNSATMSPSSAASVSVSQSGNCSGNNGGLPPHWGALLQQPMAGMLMNPAMMGMGVGVMGPGGPNMMLGEPNMLYGINLLNSPQARPQQHHHQQQQHQQQIQLSSPNTPSHQQQLIELSQAAAANNSFTTTISSSTNNCQTNPILHHLPSGIVNGSVPGPICSTSQQQQQEQQNTLPVKEIIHCKSCTLFPPNPAAPFPTTREKPPGCRTVFVGGVPENGNEELVREIFERCGEITTIRMSKKNFCHIRFELETYIENAIYLSGYRVRIGSNSDAANIGRLHVDYAQARDDLYEWECRQRQLLREQRHRERLEQERLLPPSPPPVVHYSDHEALNLTEKLKIDESFMKGVQVLMTWLERGDCSKKNANTFYSMIQSTNSHVRRLLTEKSQFEDELQKAKELARQRMQGLIMQFCQIEKVFVSACHKKVWDHFTKAQRKNIDIWKKQASEIKNMQLEEALNDRNDEEMDLSESDLDGEDSNGSPLGKRLRLDDNEQNKTLNQLKEENDALRCQLEAFKHEVDLIKVDLKTELELKDQQVRQLQEELSNHRRSPIATSSSPTQSDIELQTKSTNHRRSSTSSNNSPESCSPKTSTTFVSTSSIFTANKNRNSINGNMEVENNLEKCDSTQQLLISFSGSSEPNSNEINYHGKNASNSGLTGSSKETTSTVVVLQDEYNHTIRITEREARLVGIISTFLHVHPFGASLDYIWSYTQKILPGIYPIQIEALMFKFTMLFRQEFSGIGATLERKWIFIGFSQSL